MTFPNEHGGWRAYAVEDRVRLGVVLTIGRSVDNERVQMVTKMGPRGDVEIVTRAASAMPDEDDRILIPLDMALAILDGLAQLFGGTSDSRTLRRDYEHERARVDTMIAHLTTRDSEHVGTRRPGFTVRNSD